MHNRIKCAFGIMQGRLVPPEPGRFQSFPRERWRDEFPNAQAAGIDYLEWIVDAYGEDLNPVFSESGLAELDALKGKYSVATPAICADWFMDHPFLRCSDSALAERERFLYRLFPIAKRISAGHIVLPFVDSSRIATEEDKDLVVRLLNTAAPIAQSFGIELHLETDLNGPDFASLLNRMLLPNIKVNYDSGNSSGLGYVAHEEFAAYGDRIGSVHIKDRFRKPEGGVETRPLGLGSANFEDVFSCMRKIDYQGGVTLQVARGRDNDEVDFIRQQLTFVRRFWH